MILLSFCTWQWWVLWLLPFLLGAIAGLALGCILWCKWKQMYADMEAKVGGLNSKISGLEADLAACRKARAEVDGDLALTKGRMREMEAEMAKVKASAKAAPVPAAVTPTPKVDTPSIASGFAAGSGTTAPKVEATSAPATSIYSSIKNNNLQIIEGIGPKMESVLKEGGVANLSMLAGKSTADIQSILDSYGDKYKIIDPSTWVQQAGLAASGKWEGLIDLQKRLDTGRTDAKGMTDSKLEKILIKTGAIKAFKQDDLKAIEGIGPAIEKLMHAAGIKTWRGMSTTSVEKLQEVLTEAGPRFKLADPGTWPKQAEYAADGKFKELQEYQDFLQGGR